MAQKDFQIAIIGGGIVGLVCAIGLAKAGLEVDVFEAAVRDSTQN
jgi:salicylate hydroxylase